MAEGFAYQLREDPPCSCSISAFITLMDNMITSSGINIWKPFRVITGLLPAGEYTSLYYRKNE
jgi:hypothetical protein